VSRGQRIAQVDDRELREQLRQAEASFDVAQATIRQRDADLSFAKTNLDRSRSLFERNLLPQQTLDDGEARYQSAQAQLDLAKAQLAQASARLDELRITQANTTITSPVDGYVGRRYVDPGAFVSTNAPVVQVVDISLVRLVVNLVERDLRRVDIGARGTVDVDAFPGEQFEGRIARIAPVLDPATRTAEMEIEIPNPTKRLKPGMYARVSLITNTKTDALVVPKSAIVDVSGRRGVYTVTNRQAVFRPVTVGIEDAERIEITDGITEGEEVVSIGASSIRDGDPVLLPGEQSGPRGGGGASTTGGAAKGAAKGAAATSPAAQSGTGQ
jgi:RND family efflux transporter MFP subunit